MTDSKNELNYQHYREKVMYNVNLPLKDHTTFDTGSVAQEIPSFPEDGMRHSNELKKAIKR